ncbi:MAG: DUF1844 domain-containing protein [Myxococcota bacterium]
MTQEKTETAPFDFNTFVVSLGRAAALHLGAPDESGQIQPIDLPLAQNSIDILQMLERKTQGNLSGDEERLLASVLSETTLLYRRKEKSLDPKG